MSKVKLNILYVGPLWQGSTALHRMKALQDLGHNVATFDTHPESVRTKIRTIHYRIMYKLFGPSDLSGVNEAISEAFMNQKYDILWIDKGLAIKSSTLQLVKESQKHCIIVGYSPDDMTGNKKNRPRRFVKSLASYDIYFTTKSYCVSELEALGCPRAEFVGNAYDKYVHRPVKISEDDRKKFGGNVGFIGQWETERTKSLCFLADSGIDVRVWGYTWERCKRVPLSLHIENKPLWQDNYAKAICSFDINLCFLRKSNRDTQTTRTMEIPACSAFMLAERTDEHLELFEEGKEAEFFGSDEELLDKTKYYLSHPEKRKQIARAGRERCIKSGYSNHDRIKVMLEKVINTAKSF